MKNSVNVIDLNINLVNYNKNLVIFYYNKNPIPSIISFVQERQITL